jgi:YegS/Rv2252/BmrU family lipid kinase
MPPRQRAGIVNYERGKGCTYDRGVRDSAMKPHPLRACLITNPRSGRGQIDLSGALSVLQAQGWEIALRQKLHGGHATKLARHAVRDGYDVVVGCAGDGTISEIVDGLAGTEVAVGVLPGGTVNLWARELGVSPRLEVAAVQLVGAVRRRVDLGHVQVNGRHDRNFLLMAGLGVDGAVIAGVSKPLKRRIGKLAIVIAALRALPSYRSVPVQIEFDGITWQGRVSQVIVGNTRMYGGFTRVTPDAYIDDGLLDICLITADSPGAAGRQLASLVLRQRPSATSAESYRVASLTITSPIALPLQIDGGAERLKKEKPRADGMTYAFSVRPRALTILTPRGYNGALFQPSGWRESSDSVLPASDDNREHHEAAKHNGSTVAL